MDSPYSSSYTEDLAGGQKVEGSGQETKRNVDLKIPSFASCTYVHIFINPIGTDTTFLHHRETTGYGGDAILSWEGEL